MLEAAISYYGMSQQDSIYMAARQFVEGDCDPSMNLLELEVASDSEHAPSLGRCCVPSDSEISKFDSWCGLEWA